MSNSSSDLIQVQRMIQRDGSVQWIMRKNNKSIIWRQITAMEANQMLNLGTAKQLPDLKFVGNSKQIEI